MGSPVASAALGSAEGDLLGQEVLEGTSGHFQLHGGWWWVGKNRNEPPTKEQYTKPTNCLSAAKTFL